MHGGNEDRIHEERYVTNTNKRDRQKDSLVCVRMKAYTYKKTTLHQA